VVIGVVVAGRLGGTVPTAVIFGVGISSSPRRRAVDKGISRAWRLAELESRFSRSAPPGTASSTGVDKWSSRFEKVDVWIVSEVLAAVCGGPAVISVRKAAGTARPIQGRWRAKAFSREGNDLTEAASQQFALAGPSRHEIGVAARFRQSPYRPAA
jgi:hypothetical protein